jgi:glycine cleavage system pyridoxal-binding protein P
MKELQQLKLCTCSTVLDRKKNGNKFFVSKDVFPQTLDVLKTRSEPIGIELVIGDFKTIEFTNEFFGAYVQYPDNKGNVNDYKAFCDKAHAAGALVAVGADLLSLTLLTPPGEFGADCVGVVANVLEYQWVMADLMLHFLQPVMNTNVKFQDE